MEQMAEQILEHLLDGQEQMMARMKAGYEEMTARLKAKMDSHHEKLMAIMKASKEKIEAKREACLGSEEPTSEEMQTVAEHEGVPRKRLTGNF
jgi:hypothetical protein